MTRFWITLDQGVHFVLNVLELAKGGELFVPKIPSTKITDLARAIAPGCKQEIVGIRPGEKIHETLIGEDEGRNTTEYKDCYVIRQNVCDRPDNPKACENGGKPTPEGFNYTSDNNPLSLSIEELRDILKRIEDDYTIEKTRWSMDDIPQ
jgi:FlaA1/EpsC-like NDP-sugar epimerase